MAAAKFNITIEQGASYKRDVKITNSNGVARNLSGYTARGMVRVRFEDESPVAVFTCSQPNALGEFSFSLTSVETAALDFESGVYDIELVETAAPINVERIMMGTVFLSREVTR